MISAIVMGMTTMNRYPPEPDSETSSLRPVGLRRSRNPRPWRTWPSWVGPAATVWAAVYGVAALIWTIAGRGFPFGINDPGNESAVLRDLSPSVGAPIFAAIFLTTAVVMLALTGSTSRPSARWMYRLVLGFGWGVVAVLLVVLPDTRVLTLLGYTPMLLIGAPFGWPPDVDYSEIFTWPLVNQAYALIGGFLIAGAMLAWRRRTADACAHCGRGDIRPRWSTPESAARWGRWAVAVAAVVPGLYALSRIAWLFDIPFLVDEEFLRELRAEDGHLLGMGLAAFALVGIVLTLGLVQRWGEVFPRWMIGLGGKRVPIRLATIPASVVTVAVASAGLGFLSMPKAYTMIADGDWLVVPMLLWPAWSVALGAATLAYYIRRRGACVHCGQGG